MKAPRAAPTATIKRLLPHIAKSIAITHPTMALISDPVLWKTAGKVIADKTT